MASRKNNIQKILDDSVNDLMDEIDKVITKSIIETNDELYLEHIKMYDELIDEFYTYETKSYIRHGETKPGTRQGTALYRGQFIRKIGSNNPGFIIELNGSELLRGETRGYTTHGGDPNKVFDSIYEGHRFYNDETGYKMDYRLRYIFLNKYKYSGSLERIYNSFKNDFDYIALRMIYEKMRNKGY